jgi:hypothetical protein
MSAGTTINGVEIPVITSIDRNDGKPWEEINLVDKDKNIVFREASQTTQVSINFVLIKSLHSQNKNVEKQRKDIKSLTTTDYQNNQIDYNDISGKLSVESVDIPEESSNDTIRQGTINGYIIEQ